MNYTLQFLPLTFKIPAGTSRGFLNEKPSWILTLEKNGIKGVGEISVIEGLSPEFHEKTTFEKKVYHYIQLFTYLIEEKERGVFLTDLGIEFVEKMLKESGAILENSTLYDPNNISIVPDIVYLRFY